MNLYSYELGVTCINTDDVVKQITEKRVIAEHCETLGVLRSIKGTVSRAGFGI
jgi:hypothetical protein